MSQDNVVGLFASKPAQEGQAVCLACGHEWEASAPVGSANVPCPNCPTNRGVFRGISAPDEGLLCEFCDNDLFVLPDVTNATCVKCGQTHNLAE